MTWTTKKPTKLGVYWVRKIPNRGDAVVTVQYSSMTSDPLGQGHLHSHEVTLNRHLMPLAENGITEWAGPIPMPGNGSISPEQAQEYREVAALSCWLIDILADIAKVETQMTAEELRDQIAYTKEQADQIKTDATHRQERYRSLSWLFAARAAGHIKSTPITP